MLHEELQIVDVDVRRVFRGGRFGFYDAFDYRADCRGDYSAFGAIDILGGRVVLVPLQ